MNGLDELGRSVAALAEVVARLRSACPWDREQTRETLRSFILEEAHELVEAIDSAVPEKIREECGDLLFQVVLQAEIGRERGEFDLADAAREIAEKLIRRHPHVFGSAEATSPREVEVRWEELKRAERASSGQPLSVLAGVPLALPALARAQKVQERAARFGFDWERRDEVLVKLDEERRELAEALGSDDRSKIERELGDLLFTVVNLARFCNVHAEDALRGAIGRFQARFQYVERAAAENRKGLGELTLAEMDRLWEEAKSALRTGSSGSV